MAREESSVEIEKTENEKGVNVQYAKMFLAQWREHLHASINNNYH